MDKKYRQYSIVIHNVRKDCLPQAVEYCKKNTSQNVQAVEAYPSPPGYHLHMFVQYPNQRRKRAVLKELEKWKSAVLDPAPVVKYDDKGNALTPGRVQLDPMRGRFHHCEAYLRGETKEKPTGDVVSHVQTSCYYHATMNTKEGKKITVCWKCYSPDCLGQCCLGCQLRPHKLKDGRIRRGCCPTVLQRNPLVYEILLAAMFHQQRIQKKISG